MVKAETAGVAPTSTQFRYDQKSVKTAKKSLLTSGLFLAATLFFSLALGHAASKPHWLANLGATTAVSLLAPALTLLSLFRLQREHLEWHLGEGFYTSALLRRVEKIQPDNIERVYSCRATKKGPARIRVVMNDSKSFSLSSNIEGYDKLIDLLGIGDRLLNPTVGELIPRRV